MKNNWMVPGLLFIAVSAAFVSAQAELPEILLPQQLTEMIQSLLTKLGLLAGGIFGIYVILIAVRIHYERKKDEAAAGYPQ